MLFEAPTPSPLPTATVTQTVLVPSSVPTPVITIVPPVDTIDPWKDVVWGDFGGAALGVFGALLAAWLVIRAERSLRKDDIRRNLALDYADTARQLSKQLHLPLHGEAFEGALEKFELLTGRIIRNYSRRSELFKPIRWIMARFHRHVGNSNFALWVMYHGSPIGIMLEPLKWATNDLVELVTKINSNKGTTEDIEKLANKTALINDQLSEISTKLRVIEHTALEWMNSPHRWKPDLSVHEAHERVKKIIFDSKSTAANSSQPGEPTP